MKRGFAIVGCLLGLWACGPAFTVGEQTSALAAGDAGDVTHLGQQHDVAASRLDASSSSSEVLVDAHDELDAGEVLVVDAPTDTGVHQDAPSGDVLEHDAGEVLVDAHDELELDAGAQADAFVDAQGDVLEHDASAVIDAAPPPPPDCPNPDHCPACLNPLDLPCCTAISTCACMPRSGGTCL